MANIFGIETDPDQTDLAKSYFGSTVGGQPPVYSPAQQANQQGGDDGGNGGYQPPKVPPIDQILGSDPFYAQTVAMLKAMGADDQALAGYKISRLRGYYGNANDPLSVLGRIFLSFKDRGRSIINTLAGHNMIFSGETGWQQNRNALQYQQQQYDANYALKNQVDAIHEALAQAERQRKFQELQAQQDAVTRWIQDNMQQ